MTIAMFIYRAVKEKFGYFPEIIQLTLYVVILFLFKTPHLSKNFWLPAKTKLMINNLFINKLNT